MGERHAHKQSISRHSIGATLFLHWYCTGTLRWYFACTLLAQGLNYVGTALVLHWHHSGTALALQWDVNGTGLAPHRYYTCSTGIVLVDHGDNANGLPHNSNAAPTRYRYNAKVDPNPSP